MSVTTVVPAESAAWPRHHGKHGNKFEEIDLVSNIPGRAQITDPHLINPWGMSLGKALWVSAADADLALVYTGGGSAGPIRKVPLEVEVEGGPTGQVFNKTRDFRIRSDGRSAPAKYLFATESGTIQGWNPDVDRTHAIVGATKEDAVYKGLTQIRTRTRNLLLAADFFHGTVDVYNTNFKLQKRPSFVDPKIPKGFSPFNVQRIGHKVFVTYAKQDPDDPGEEVKGAGLGFVSFFTSRGAFIHRFHSRGPLNAPWAVTLPPRNFGKFSHSLLIGNFGDGRINAFNRFTGRFQGPLRDPDGDPISIDGLWGLIRGNSSNGGRNALWFAAGINDEEDGLLGLIRRDP
ncbi:TIGR03118 family protein [Nonomuraea sp. NPDC050536]|uniref:TIGR03118 family protein n=1 Tax=Nonomuraea sp. NPDC050536 TaxID=3364366 RepID=UPI0037CBF8C3